MRQLFGAVAMGLVWIAAGLAQAQPQPQSVSASINHGQQITIFGSQFGSKSPAAPWLWDNFEDGAVGQVVTGPNWATYSAYGGIEPQYSADNARVPGHLSTKQGPLGNTSLEAKNFPNGCNGGEIYVTGWFWGTQTGGSRSMKFIQLNDGDWGYPEFRTGGDFNWYWSDAYGCGGEHTMSNQGIGSNPFQQKWERWEWRGKFDTNGLWQTYRNSQLVANGSGDFSLGSGCCVNSIYMASYYGIGDPAPAGSQGWWYWDEIYIDTTPARVEIGDASTWSACNRREVQIPTAWGSNSISITCNQGGFSGTGPAYLYVVDENGAVNQNGLLVNFGSGGGGGDAPPFVQVLTPVPSGGSYSLPDTVGTMVIEGTASDDFGLVEVRWTNGLTGDSGVVDNQSGNWTSWRLEGMPLGLGANVFTFVAKDTSNRTASATITIDRGFDYPARPGRPRSD